MLAPTVGAAIHEAELDSKASDKALIDCHRRCLVKDWSAEDKWDLTVREAKRAAPSLLVVVTVVAVCCARPYLQHVLVRSNAKHILRGCKAMHTLRLCLCPARACSGAGG